MESLEQNMSSEEQSNLNSNLTNSENDRIYNELHQRHTDTEIITSSSNEKKPTSQINITSQQEISNTIYPMENFSYYIKKGEEKTICKELNSTIKNKSNSEKKEVLVNESSINIKLIPYNVSGENESKPDASVELLSSTQKEFPFLREEDQYSEIQFDEQNKDFSSKTVIDLNFVFQENNFVNIINFFEKFFLFISESLSINKKYQKPINSLTDEQIDLLQKFIIDFEKKTGAEFIEENENIKEESLNEDNSKQYQDTVLHILEKEYNIEINEDFKHRIKKLIAVIEFFKSNTKEIIRKKFQKKIIASKDLFLFIKN